MITKEIDDIKIAEYKARIDELLWVLGII